jgi:asparagine synthase (glutamine-hydrolysing)
VCGIAGIFEQAEDPRSTTRRIETMTHALVHRGPDDGAIAEGFGWALGARRLAIQDLSSAGRQPMSCGHYTIVFNGEIYNFPTLRHELEGLGHGFASMSDTEVALAAFMRWRTAAFARFNGMFALAIVDSSRRCAWLARDRWGKKPLFIGRLPGRIIFGSELKALLAVEKGNLHVDRRALAHYFRYQYVPGDQSIFSEVEKLAPASWLKIDLRDCSEERGIWWELPVQRDRVPPASPDEVLSALRGAVRRRLISDVPVGAFLSGGTDSSAVVACMKAVAQDCRTFSIGFRDRRFDESAYALAVANHLGTNHRHLVVEERDALDLIPEFVKSYDEPFADSSALPTMAVARMAREHVTVALSGDGGDELFSGYPRYRTAPFLAAVAQAPSEIAKLAPLAYRLPVAGRRVGILAEAARARSPGAAYRELISIWKTPELELLMPEADSSDEYADYFDQGTGSLVARMMRCDTQSYLVDDILQKVDRATMAVSLEARNPLLDPEVAEVAFRSIALAEESPGRKPLLRAALSLVLPKRLVNRPKRGFGVPIGDWLCGELRPAVEDLVLCSQGEHYDAGVARRVCLEHLSGRRDATHHVWSLVAFELWRDRWYKGIAVA